MRTEQHQKGFTIVELMVVVAIVGILAAIALPTYLSYMTRSKLVEEISFLDSQKIALAEAYQTNSAFPATTSSPVQTTVPTDAKYMTAVAYTVAGANAGIIVTLGGLNTAMNGTFLGLFGAGNADGTVTWTCATAASATATAPAATGVVAMYPYLPAACQH